MRTELAMTFTLTPCVCSDRCGSCRFSPAQLADPHEDEQPSPRRVPRSAMPASRLVVARSACPPPAAICRRAGGIVAALRGWFAARASSRWRPAALQVSPGNETHLHAFATDADRHRRSRRAGSTSTPRPNSPARSCSRPARRGSVDFARVFRNRERSALHHPEFTMLEWYRADEALRAADGAIAPRSLALRRARRARRRFAFAGAWPIPSPSRSG